MHKTQGGFSLLELMIAVAIAGIVVGFAISSYQSQVQDSRRAEAQAQLMDLATSLEAWRSQNFSYAGATVAGLSPDLAASTFYNVTLTLTNNNQAFELVANPIGSMVGSGQVRSDSQGRTCYNPASDSACDLANPALRWGK